MFGIERVARSCVPRSLEHSDVAFIRVPVGPIHRMRRQADVFTDLVELQSKIGRDPSERKAPREPRNHAPKFLQRATTMVPSGDDEDFDD